jgi:hypothetical protein
MYRFEQFVVESVEKCAFDARLLLYSQRLWRLATYWTPLLVLSIFAGWMSGGRWAESAVIVSIVMTAIGLLVSPRSWDNTVILMDLHVILLKHGKTSPDERQQLAWYHTAKEWMQRNGLDNRLWRWLLWNGHAQRSFERTWATVSRRAASERYQSKCIDGGFRSLLRDKATQIDESLEELSLFGEAVCVLHYGWLILISDCIQSHIVCGVLGITYRAWLQCVSSNYWADALFVFPK